jgi:hypothetical protein
VGLGSEAITRGATNGTGMTDWVAQICEASVRRLLESATNANRIYARYEAGDRGKLCALLCSHDAPTNTVPQPCITAVCGTRLARRTGNALPRRALDSHGVQSGAPGDAYCHQRWPARGIPLRQPQRADVPLLRTPRCLRQDARCGVRTVASIGCRRVERRSNPPRGDNIGPTRHAVVGHYRQPTAVPSQRHVSTVSLCAARAPRVDPALRAAWCRHRHASG